MPLKWCTRLMTGGSPAMTTMVRSIALRGPAASAFVLTSVLPGRSAPPARCCLMSLCCLLLSPPLLHASVCPLLLSRCPCLAAPALLSCLRAVFHPPRSSRSGPFSSPLPAGPNDAAGQDSAADTAIAAGLAEGIELQYTRAAEPAAEQDAGVRARSPAAATYGSAAAALLCYCCCSSSSWPSLSVCFSRPPHDTLLWL